MTKTIELGHFAIGHGYNLDVYLKERNCQICGKRGVSVCSTVSHGFNSTYICLECIKKAGEEYIEKFFKKEGEER